jgi:hypothetical protein
MKSEHLINSISLFYLELPVPAVAFTDTNHAAAM